MSQITRYGLPEVDDRYHVWRVPLKKQRGSEVLGEIVIDAYTGEVIVDKTTRPEIIEARLLKKAEAAASSGRSKATYEVSQLRNTIGLGDCVELMAGMPAESVDLVFTSPPYFNARPQYSEYDEYQSYLLFMKSVIRAAERVLREGRFFVMNTSPVLLRRASRNESSKRIAVPFDLHGLFIECGFEFVDDIIWVKPEGAGWATGRGRRFAADRNPLQYKAVPVTEYVLVYRKKSQRLIDWHIRNHPDRDLVAASKIGDGYEKTNVWRIQPNTRSPHPAPFPMELAEKVIRYYSFKGDVVLDPFAGSGTSGAAAVKLDRRFVLFDNNEKYATWIRDSAQQWLGKRFKEVLLLNITSPASEGLI
ncbi:DNA-methyltransferase [Cognatilysobacter terrigena]|uniref:DNA-methyltransferase n=1 Tax=Cognatilysobacter terrigena TaxID=2488749 RepID=UPI001AACDA86|nr:site-specific DNA-methyltransferase [Lysobacter terrigena]